MFPKFGPNRITCLGGDRVTHLKKTASKLSLWEIPEELRHRGDVAGLIENGPERKDDPPAQPEPTVVEVT